MRTYICYCRVSNPVTCRSLLNLRISRLSHDVVTRLESQIRGISSAWSLGGVSDAGGPRGRVCSASATAGAAGSPGSPKAAEQFLKSAQDSGNHVVIALQLIEHGAQATQ
jgi:hypothetical protein